MARSGHPAPVRRAARPGPRATATRSGPFPIETVLHRVREAVRDLAPPVVTAAARRRRDPFRVLISCVISLRTKDEVTAGAAARLLGRARSPRGMLALSEREIARLIFPAGFYRVKARQLRAICARLIETFGGKVPDAIDDLLTLPGVGRKTANLVVAEGFEKPAICVDVHVHRIVNRWGYVRTRTPEQTEMRLRTRLPRHWWIPINPILVAFGRAICRPVSPHCSRCPVAGTCRRVGVTRSR
jgi:endonuclease III